MNRRTLISTTLALGGCAAISGSEPNARPLSKAEARRIVTPWYSLFTVRNRRDIRTVFDEVISTDFQSYSGDMPTQRASREATIALITGLASLIPDMEYKIKELLVSGDRVVVRGETTGTPAGEFLGQLATGKSFRIMSIDILTIRNGKIVTTYHMEDWMAALAQLRN